MSNVFEHAVRLLARREHACQELFEKLKQKGYATHEIEAALTECQRLGLQSDQRYAETLCRVRIRQGYGPIRIRRELQQWQIAPDLLETVLGQERHQWHIYARAVIDKKYHQNEDSSYEARQKQKKFLLYRGFSTETIQQVFHKEFSV